MEKDCDMSEIQPLIDIAVELIEPRALYDVHYIDEKIEDAIIVTGRRLKSRVLRKNLDQTERVFPFVITLGPKLGEKQAAGTDLLENFYLDTIGNVALNSARKHLKRHLISRFALEKISSMSPGSLADWPIEEQAPLFELLGDVETSIGVKLTDSLLMLPAKSISGIYFPTEASFFSCQLCPRQRCESRKAKYDAPSLRKSMVSIIAVQRFTVQGSKVNKTEELLLPPRPLTPSSSRIRLCEMEATRGGEKQPLARRRILLHLSKATLNGKP